MIIVRVRKFKNDSGMYNANVYVLVNDEIDSSEGGGNILRDPVTMLEHERCSYMWSRSWEFESLLDSNIKAIIEDAREYVNKIRESMHVSDHKL